MTQARGRRGAEHRLAAEPNVIPFIDVLLVLLIIFMVTAPKPTVDLQLDLPRARPPAAAALTPTVVDVRAAGEGYRLLVAEREVTLDGLTPTVLALALANDPSLIAADVLAEARIYVRAEQSVAYGDVVAVIDELQHDGFEKVGVFAQAAEGA